MARGYQTPMERKRMRPANSPVPEAPAEGDSDSPASRQSGDGGAGENLTQVLPKEFFGDHECEVGETYEIRIKAIDPETGEKEVEFVPPNGDRYTHPDDTPSVSGIDEMEMG